MSVYRTRQPRERLNVRYIKRRGDIRIAAQGVAVYVRPRAVVELVLVLLVTVVTFRAGVAYAYHERGYQAKGGEYLFLLTPPIYYAVKRTVADWIADLRELWP
jgi:hypothetical protein